MFNFRKFGIPIPKTDNFKESGYQAFNKYGPKAWYKKVKGAILMKNTKDTESSSSPSSGEDETVKQRLLIRELSDEHVQGDDAKRLAQRTANTALYVSRFLLGLFLVQIFHLLLTYQSTWKPIQAGVWFGIIGFTVSCGMAYSKAVRAVAALVMPMMCTSSGRAILISYSATLMLTGPLNNIAYNYGEISRSMLCGNELAFNITEGLRPKIQEKQFQLLDALDNTIDVIVSAVEAVQATYENIAKSFAVITDAVREADDFMQVAVVTCDIEASSFVCNLPGDISRKIKKVITKPFTKALTVIQKLFFFGVHFDHEFVYNIKTTKTMEEIKEDILKEVKTKFGRVNDLLYWTRLLMAFSTALVIIKATLYRKKYLTNNDFDNLYITRQFKHLDKKCAKKRNATVLPLRWKESKKYISPKRCWMSKPEVKKCFRGWLFVTANMVWSLYFMAVDSILYTSMKAISLSLSLKSTTVIEDLIEASKKTSFGSQANDVLGAFITLNVFGKGLVAVIYRAVVKALQRVTGQHGYDINIDKCLPQPSVPSFFSYIVVFCILQLCYTLVYVQAYMLRLRRYIMARYYPERERQRIMYLRRKILNNRGVGHVEDLKRKIRKAANEVEKNEARSKLSIWGRLIKWSNIRGIRGMIARKLTGRDAHSCSICRFSGSHSEGHLFVKCRRPGCAIEYCTPCFDDLHRICPSCLTRHGEKTRQLRRLSKILSLDRFSDEENDDKDEDMTDTLVASSGISDSSDEETFGGQAPADQDETVVLDAVRQNSRQGLGRTDLASDVDGLGTTKAQNFNQFATLNENFERNSDPPSESTDLTSPARATSMKRLKKFNPRKIRVEPESRSLLKASSESDSDLYFI